MEAEQPDQKCGHEATDPDYSSKQANLPSKTSIAHRFLGIREDGLHLVPPLLPNFNKPAPTLATTPSTPTYQFRSMHHHPSQKLKRCMPMISKSERGARKQQQARCNSKSRQENVHRQAKLHRHSVWERGALTVRASCEPIAAQCPVDSAGSLRGGWLSP